VKVLDFGLAKAFAGEREEMDLSKSPTLSDAATQQGIILGTLAYMSPEQARGQNVGPRSDIFNFGIVLYEMLTGKLPFQGASSPEILNAIINIPAPPLKSSVKGVIIPDVQRILDKCLAKDPDERYPATGDLIGELRAAYRRFQAESIAGRDAVKIIMGFFRNPAVAVSALVVLALLAALIAWGVHRDSRIKWAKETALPEIEGLVEKDNYLEAFTLASQAERYIAKNPALKALWPRIARNMSFRTEPAGAGVYFRIGSDREKGEKYLGLTPVEKTRLPRGPFWLRIEKAGYETVENLIGLDIQASPEGVRQIRINLDAKGSIPPGMVRIPQATAVMLLLFGVPVEMPVVPAYFIDRHEVTNAEYKEFVDQGGYSNPEYWEHKFVREGRVLPFQEAMAEFRDRTGRPGPSTWEVGSFPEGKGDYPASGVSWYEAAAYAKFAGKSLPTIYHWVAATNLNLATLIIPTSNFGNQGPRAVAGGPVGPGGTYDMAGNVKEWCRNASKDQRLILGGSWREPTYMFYFADAQSPFDRSETYGFRCMKHLEVDVTARENLAKEIPLWNREDSIGKPVSDEVFEACKRRYDYDPTDLEDTIEAVDESSPFWIRQKITFSAAYGNDRVIAYLYIPKKGTPPFQTVVFFPGLNARWDPNLQVPWVDFLVQSGRAVMYPIYKATHERAEADLNLAAGTKASVDYNTYWINDLRRSIDYMETREDIDMDRLAYYGFSWGAGIGPIALALEPQFDAGIFLDGGLIRGELPEADGLNFAPRVHVAVLMLNGLNDSVLPTETSQKPLYELLGTPSQDKRWVHFECGHSVLSFYRNQGIREILDWLDQRFGKPH
jgi:cephalosporin-C deacetylase-like acetyl esterase